MAGLKSVIFTLSRLSGARTFQASRQLFQCQYVQSGVTSVLPSRAFCLGSARLCEPTPAEEELPEEEAEGKMRARRRVVDVDTSMRYLQSKAYDMTYGDDPVWVAYKRNFKGRRPPRKTREMCIRAGLLATGNPCPICRDEYLVVHPKNVGLLKQFIDPDTGKITSFTKTQVCQHQHKMLKVALQQAWDKGYLEMPLPFRRYDYSNYYPDWKETEGELPSSPKATSDPGIS